MVLTVSVVSALYVLAERVAIVVIVSVGQHGAALMADASWLAMAVAQHMGRAVGTDLTDATVATLGLKIFGLLGWLGAQLSARIRCPRSENRMCATLSREQSPGFWLPRPLDALLTGSKLSPAMGSGPQGAANPRSRRPKEPQTDDSAGPAPAATGRQAPTGLKRPINRPSGERGTPPGPRLPGKGPVPSEGRAVSTVSLKDLELRGGPLLPKGGCRAGGGWGAATAVRFSPVPRPSAWVASAAGRPSRRYLAGALVVDPRS